MEREWKNLESKQGRSVVEVSSVPEFDATEGLTKKWGRTSQDKGPVRWLVLVLVWAGWCWFFVKEKYYWLVGLGWLKPTSEQAERPRGRGVFVPAWRPRLGKVPRHVRRLVEAVTWNRISRPSTPNIHSLHDWLFIHRLNILRVMYSIRASPIIQWIYSWLLSVWKLIANLLVHSYNS